MKKNLIIIAFLAFLFPSVSVNAQSANPNEISGINTDIGNNKETQEGTTNTEEKVKESVKHLHAYNENKRINKIVNKEFTNKEKEKCSKQEKINALNIPTVKKCSANLATCHKNKP